MNERRIAIMVLALLIGLNVVLFGYYLYQKWNANWVPAERVELVRELYQESGIEITAEPDQMNFPKPYLILGEANLDSLVEKFLEGQFDKSYIYGSKVQYTSGDLTILTDRTNHQILYQDDWKIKIQEERMEQNGEIAAPENGEGGALLLSAEEFAKAWLGEDVYLAQTNEEKDGVHFVFYQKQDQAVLYFNRLEFCMIPEGVSYAQLSYWSVEGKSEISYELMPIDEILYAQLSKIKEEINETEKEEVVQIMDGYQLKETDSAVEAVPSVTIVLKSGKEYIMNRVAG